MATSDLVKVAESLSAPARDLIQLAKDFGIGFFHPYQVVRVAKGNAKAKMIDEENKIEITDLQRRAADRWLKEESRKQQNMESIVAKGITLLDEDARVNEIEDDWVFNFFNKCRDFTDDQMQDLWAKMLAGEANEPGSFSPQTVNSLSNFSSRDAEVFNQFCNFVWDFGEPNVVITHPTADIYKENGLSFERLNLIEGLGLARTDVLHGFCWDYECASPCYAVYQGKKYQLTFPSPNSTEVPLGKVLLSRVGKELCRICSCKPVEQFVEHIRLFWSSSGVNAKLINSDD